MAKRILGLVNLGEDANLGGCFARDCRNDQDERKRKSRYGSHLGSTMSLLVFLLTKWKLSRWCNNQCYKVIWMRYFTRIRSTLMSRPLYMSTKCQI